MSGTENISCRKMTFCSYEFMQVCRLLLERDQQPVDANYVMSVHFCANRISRLPS